MSTPARGYGTNTPGRLGWQELDIASARTPQEAQARAFAHGEQNRREAANRSVDTVEALALLAMLLVAVWKILEWTIRGIVAVARWSVQTYRGWQADRLQHGSHDSSDSTAEFTPTSPRVPGLGEPHQTP